MNTKKNTKSTKKTKRNTNNKKNDKNLIIIKDLELKLEEQKTKNIKLLAEFDNYQKRTILERENSRKYDGLNLIKDLLPIFDDIDRTINHKDDVDTYIKYDTDRLRFFAGNEQLIDAYEGAQDYVKLGDGGDVDINLNDALHVDGLTKNVGIGTVSYTHLRAHET